MAYVCIFRSSKKKVVGNNSAGIRQDVILRFPELRGVNFKVTYYDEDVRAFLDLDDDCPPPRGATLRVEYEVMASETELDSDATLFSIEPVKGTQSSCAR